MEFLIRQIREGVPLATHEVPRHYNLRCHEMPRHQVKEILGLEEDIRVMDEKRFLGKVKGEIDSDFFPFWFTNPVFMISKSNGKLRRIDDLSHCGNSLLPKDLAPISFSNKKLLPVRFSSIKAAISAIHSYPGRIMATWDMTSAYHHLCINHKHWGCTGFKHKGKYYFSPRLCFGSQASPSRFNIYSEAIAELILL